MNCANYLFSTFLFNMNILALNNIMFKGDRFSEIKQTEYINERGHNVKIYTFPDGDKFTFERDENNRIIKTLNYCAKNNFEDCTEHFYDENDPNLETTISYTKSGDKIVGKLKNGDMFEFTKYNKDDKPQYIARKKRFVDRKDHYKLKTFYEYETCENLSEQDLDTLNKFK